MKTMILSDDYLVKGITALSRAMEENWVAGHYGAAVIAAYYFCHENKLPPTTINSIQHEIDRLISKHHLLFTPISLSKTDPSLIDQLSQSLSKNISELRIQGHNVIFTMLAIKALKQRPEMITPEIIAGICKLIASFDDKLITEIMGIDVSTLSIEKTDSIPEYINHQVIAEFTFNELIQFKRVYYRGIRGEAGHLVTHAQSLIELSRLGYATLARKGYHAHQLQAKILRKIHGLDRKEIEIEQPVNSNPLTPVYWDSDLEKKDWLTGHAFKYGYHFYDLLKEIADTNLKEKSIRQMEFILMHP